MFNMWKRPTWGKTFPLLEILVQPPGINAWASSCALQSYPKGRFASSWPDLCCSPRKHPWLLEFHNNPKTVAWYESIMNHGTGRRCPKGDQIQASLAFGCKLQIHMPQQRPCLSLASSYFQLPLGFQTNDQKAHLTTWWIKKKKKKKFLLRKHWKIDLTFSSLTDLVNRTFILKD